MLPSSGLVQNEIISLRVQAAPLTDKSPPFVVNHSPAPNATGHLH
jgi:hypothetical protein